MILIPHTHGGFIKRLLHRLWLLIVIDVYTRAILGYYVSLNLEYKSDDVLLCIKNALTPWKPRTLTIPGLEYATGAGLPSGVIPQLVWVTFEEFSYDNAKANLAGNVVKKIASVAGCAINPGPVESPERRAIIERWFETIEEATGHRVPSTTGSYPQDPRRTNPDAAAEEFEIGLDHVYELMDLVIARYNATPHSGIGYKAPLELMAQFAADEQSLMNKIPEDKRNKLGLLDVEFKRTVRGNIKEGRRPYINCEGARYRNEILARSPELIGQRLTLVMDPEDPRSVTAFFPDGAELGDLTANGFWGITPHTLEMRKAILSLARQRLLYLTENQDPIPVYLDYLATGKKSKSKSRALAKAHLHNTAIKTSTASTARSTDEKAFATEQVKQKNNHELGRTFTF
jgi:transposase InsO family protein